jgi:hypothetical protein
LKDNGQTFDGASVNRVIDSTTRSTALFIRKNNKVYELSVTYPFGFYEDRELLLSYSALAVGLEINR